MPYLVFLTRLRWYLRQPWLGQAKCTPRQAQSYGAHSGKVALLSFARQANICEEQRGEQGHHRQHAGRASVRLYSRDDVWGALRLQRELSDQVANGFRPMCAQQRGAAQPLPETPVQIPPPCDNWEMEVQPTFNGLCLSSDTTAPALFRVAEVPLRTVTHINNVEAVPLNEEAESEGQHSSSDESDSDDGHDVPDPDVIAPSEDDLTEKTFYIVNLLRGTMHVAVPATDSHAENRVLEFPDGRWATACGSKLALPISCYKLSPIPVPFFHPCGLRACACIFPSSA
jgi:hypothetical protein